MNYNVFFETLGCAKNQVDTEVMIGILNNNNYFVTDNPEEAHVVVVNTCGFIESAKEESVNTIIELLELKQSGQCEVFVVTGCLAERYAKELKEEIPEVDAFVGTTHFDSILPIIDQAFRGEAEGATYTGDIDKDFSEELPRVLTTPKHFAYLKIAEGCDNHCTYCIIPKLRGKYRSRRMEDILNEANRLVSWGVKELVIIAQDTTRYGIDLYDRYRLGDLLRELNKIEDLKWIRLQYCYPDVIDDDLIQAIAESEKVVKYIDIPIQHGSDAVLKRMNRKTSRQQIIDVVEKLRANVPDISIRTTLIAGFPGETDEDFEQLLDLIQRLKFDKLGAFAYSVEEDTAAARLPEQLDDEIKNERRDLLLEQQMMISAQRLERFMGKTIEVVIEEEVPNEPIYVGRSSYDAPEVDGVVYVHTDQELEMGTFVQVRINDTMEYDLIGEVVDESCK